MATSLVRALVPTVVVVLAAAGCSRPGSGPAASASAALDPARPLPSPVPDVVARVNGQPIRIHQILPIAKAELDRFSVAERDRKKPEVVRQALQRYVERELLLQEALARGVEADSRQVDWTYDQLRREHADEDSWGDFLARQGMDPQSFRAELRQQHTVSALVEREAGPALAGAADDAARQRMLAEVQEALLGRLRAKARVELFL